MQDDYTSTEHILLALTESPENRRLEQYGINKDAILKALVSVRGSQRVSSQNPESTYQSLEKYGRDLTAMARQGKLDPVIGRDEEIRRVIQILSRRTKNNPALIGEPGVGKTAVVEGSGTAHGQRRCARRLEEQTPDPTGYGLIDRRCQVPRRI